MPERPITTKMYYTVVCDLAVRTTYSHSLLSLSDIDVLRGDLQRATVRHVAVSRVGIYIPATFHHVRRGWRWERECERGRKENNDGHRQRALVCSSEDRRHRRHIRAAVWFTLSSCDQDKHVATIVVFRGERSGFDYLRTPRRVYVYQGQLLPGYCSLSGGLCVSIELKRGARVSLRTWAIFERRTLVVSCLLVLC